MRMPVGRLSSRHDPGQVDAKIPQTRVVAEPPVVAHRIHGAVRLRIAGEIALAHRGRIERWKWYRRFLGHVGSSSKTSPDHRSLLYPSLVARSNVSNTNGRREAKGT